MNAETRGYGLWDATVKVGCDVPGAQAWLAEFFAPAFDVGSNAGADFSVAIAGERAAYEAAAATRPTGFLASAACFAQDQKVAVRPSWSGAGETLVEDPKHGVLWRLCGTRVTVLVHPNPDRARLEGMRVIRELASTAVLASRARMQLHAAALETGGRAVLVAGPKGSGKTTLLAYLAASVGAGILANDRVVLQQNDSGFAVRGIPTIVSLRPGMLRLLPYSFAGIPRVERPVQLTMVEADGARALVGGVDGTVRLRLSPAQFARELGATLSAEAQLSAIVFPRRHADPDGVDVFRLVPADAARVLLEARFGLQSGKVGPTIFEQLIGCAPERGADDALLQHIAAVVPCFSVSLGARAFANAHAAHAVWSTCLGA